jgi:GNAT superfamily N-acetyltransferase
MQPSASLIECKIRRATRDDVPVLTDFILEEACEAEGRYPERGIVESGVRAAVEAGAVAGYWLVVDAELHPIGSTAVYVEWSDWHAAPYWWIHAFYLRPHVRGQGLAERVIKHLEDCAREAGAVELRLYVHRGNARAIAAYAKAGFEAMPYAVMARPLLP